MIRCPAELPATRSSGGAATTAVVSARPADVVLPVAIALTLVVVGLEQVTHTSTDAVLAYPVYEALHWLSDSLMALPLAVVAVWTGWKLIDAAGYRDQTAGHMALKATAIVVIFALLLVPGAALHDEADRLTHTHAALAIHTHGAAVPRTVDAPAVLGYLSHALSDGLEAQVLGLPVAMLALLVTARARRKLAIGGEAVRERAPPAAVTSGVITQLGGEHRT